MKKLALMLVSMVLLPVRVFAFNFTPDNSISNKHIDIPTRFSSSSETTTIEYGCPVMDVVEAKSSEEALQMIGSICMEAAKAEVVKKPGVFDVINVSVVWPDVKISEANGTYSLTGTVFLETLIMQDAGRK
jgi:hypothetical protein